MYNLNEANIPEIGKWSTKEMLENYIEELLNNKLKKMNNITIEHQIILYILVSISKRSK